MQLEAMLRSFQRHCRDNEVARVAVLYTTSDEHHENQYRQLQAIFENIAFVRETDFKNDLLALMSDHRFVLFLVDDNLFVADFALADAQHHLDHQPQALAFSLRLGRNITYHYMSDRPQAVPVFAALGSNVLTFDWTSGSRYFGYPLDLSSSVYRTGDLQPLLLALDYSNPNTLEAVLDFSKTHFRPERCRLLCYSRSVAFCNPINIVQRTYKNRGGQATRYSVVSTWPGSLTRVSVSTLPPLLASRPHSAHQEVDYVFEKSDSRLARTAAKTPAVIKPVADFNVSIVIVTYNRCKWLGEAMQSALAQRCPATEILVIDDGSTDNTEAVVHSFADPRIRYLKKEINRGRPLARNTGVREAAEIISCGLTMTICFPTIPWKTMPRRSAKTSATTFCMVSCNILMATAALTDAFFDPPDWSHQTIRLLNGLLWGCVIPNPGTMVKKSLYTQAGDYDPKYSRAQDYEFWTRAAQFAIPKKVDAVVCRYRIHDRNISYGGSIDTSYESVIMRKLLQHHKLQELFPDQIWREPVPARTAVCRTLAAKLFEYNDYFNARKYLHQISVTDLSSGDVSQRIKCDLYMGDFNRALSEFHYLAASSQLKPSVAQEIREYMSAYIGDVNAVKSDFDVKLPEAWNRCLKELIKRYDTTFDTVMLMGRWLESANLPARAYIFYKTAVRCNPEDKEALRAARRVSRTEDEKRELLAVRDRILFKERFYDDPNSSDLNDAASQLADPVFQNNRMEPDCQFQTESIINEGRRWYQAEKTDRALDVLMNGIKSSPDQVQLYYTLAEILCDSHQYHASLGVLEQIPSGNDELFTLELTALCHVGLGQYQKAQPIVSRMLSLQPSSAPALNLKGNWPFRWEK